MLARAVTWTLSFATGNRPRDWVAAGFLSGLSAGVRPDLLPFALIVTCFAAWNLLRRPSRSSRAWFAVLALILAAAARFCCAAFGISKRRDRPFPSPASTKRYFFAEDHWPLLHKITEEGKQIMGFCAMVGPLVLVLPRLAKFTLGKVLLLVMALFVAALFVQFPGEFKVNELRYPVVLVPLLLWGLGMMVGARGEHRRNGQRLMVICALYATAVLAVCLRYYKDERDFFERGPHQIAAWCQTHIPPGTPILVHDAGYLAYSTNFRTVDIVGLKTPAAIPLNRQSAAWPTAGRGRARAVTKMAAAFGSHYLIVNLEWPPVAHLPQEIHSLGWGVDLVYWSGTYGIYRLTPPAE